MTAKVVHHFQKNTLERVQACITTFKGKEYADIRVHFEADAGEWKPTRKGITIAGTLILVPRGKQPRRTGRSTRGNGDHVGER